MEEKVFLKISVMEWGDYENLATVIALHKVRKLASKIFTGLKKLKMQNVCVSDHQATHGTWDCF